MKYMLLVLIAVLAIIGVALYVNHGNDGKQISEDTRVETLIGQDIAYADSAYGKCIFWECRVVMERPFNESASFSPEEVTNVFQTNVQEDDAINTTVYMIAHINGIIDKEIHENAFVTDDVELNADSIRITFAQAFALAKNDSTVNTTSKYVTLRHGFGRYACNPFYTFGNDNTGHFWVDAVTGKVMSVDPTSIPAE